MYISITDTFSNGLRFLTSTIAPSNWQSNGVLQNMPWYPRYVQPPVGGTYPYWNNLSLGANSTGAIDVTFWFNEQCGTAFIENSVRISLVTDDHFMPWTSNPGTNTWMMTLRPNVNGWVNTLEQDNGNNRGYFGSNIFVPTSPGCGPTLETNFDLIFGQKTYNDVDGYVFPGQEIDYTMTYYNSGDARNWIYIGDSFPTGLQYLGIVSTWQFYKAEDSPIWDYWMGDFLNSQIDRAILEATDIAANSDYITNIPTTPYALTQTYHPASTFATYFTWRLEYYCIKNNPDLNNAAIWSLDFFRDNYISRYDSYYSWGDGIYDKRDSFQHAWAETTLDLYNHQVSNWPISDIRNSIKNCIYQGVYNDQISQGYSVAASTAYATSYAIDFSTNRARDISIYSFGIHLSVWQLLPQIDNLPAVLNNYNYYTANFPINVDLQQVYSTLLQSNSSNLDPYFVGAACSNLGMLWNQHFSSYRDFASCDVISFNSYYQNPGGLTLYPYDILSSGNMSDAKKLNYLLNRYPYRANLVNSAVYKIDFTLWDTYARYRFPIYNLSNDMLDRTKDYTMTYDQYLYAISNPSNYLTGNRYDIGSGQYIRLWYPEPTVRTDFTSNAKWIALSYVYMSWYSTGSVTFRFKVREDVLPWSSITNEGNIANNTHGNIYNTWWTYCKNPYNTWFVPIANAPKFYDRYLYGSCSGNVSTSMFWYDNKYFIWETIPWPNNTWAATVFVTWSNPIELSVTNTPISPWPYNPGDIVVYNIEYCNNWLDDLTWVIVQDVYDWWLTYLTSNLSLMRHYSYLRKIRFWPFDIAAGTCLTGSVTFRIKLWFVGSSLNTTTSVGYIYGSGEYTYFAWPWDIQPNNNVDQGPIVMTPPPPTTVYTYSWSKFASWEFTTWSIVMYTISWSNPNSQTGYFDLLEDYGTGITFLWFTWVIASWLELDKRTHDLTWTKLTLLQFAMSPNSSQSLQLEFQLDTGLALYERVDNNFYYDYSFYSGFSDCMSGDIDTWNNISYATGYILPLNTIAWTIYHDIDTSFIYESGSDIQLSGVLVTLLNISGDIWTWATDSSGNYLFTWLSTGIYQVTYDLPSWYMPEVANTGSIPGTLVSGLQLIHNIELIWDTHSIDNNFWLVLLPVYNSIDGYVYIDDNITFIFDSGDSPLSGIQVNLTDTSWNNYIIYTDSSWYYIFTGLMDHIYFVTYINNTIYNSVVSNSGTVSWAVKGNTSWNQLIENISLSGWEDSIDNNFGLRYIPILFDLSIDKKIFSPTSWYVNSGEVVIYQIEYYLSGDSRDDIQVEDIIPLSMIFEPSGTTTGYIISGDRIIWSWLTLLSNTTWVLTISTIYNWSTDSPMLNTAIVWTTWNIYDNFTWETNTWNNTDVATISPTPYMPTCDMSIIKDTDTSTGTIWTYVLYTLTYTNNGPDTCQDVIIKDFWPMELDYISSSPIPLSTWSTITWDIWDVLANTTWVIYVTWVINSGAQPYQIVYNTSSVSTITTETNTWNNTWSTNSPVTWLDIGIYKSVNTGIVYSWEDVTWTLYYYNNSVFDATGVMVYDVLPPALQYMSSDPSYNLLSGSSTYIRDIGNLPAGSNWYISITTKLLTTWSHINLTVIDRKGTGEWTWNNSYIEVVTGIYDEPVLLNSISWLVYYDTNNNLVYDSWDILLTNISILLTDNNNNTFFGTTDSSGNYLFTWLSSWVYQVNYVQPSWYSPIVANTWSITGTIVSGLQIIFNINLIWDTHSIANNFWLTKITSTNPPGGWVYTPIPPPSDPFPPPLTNPPTDIPIEPVPPKRRIIDIIEDIIFVDEEKEENIIIKIIPKTGVDI